jgi:hypothetical protein
MKLLTILGAVLAGTLVLLGMGGTAYHMFRDGGLIEQGLGVLWEAQYHAPVMTIITVLAGIYVAKIIYDSQIGNKRNSKIPDLVMLIFVGIGIFLLYRLIVTGKI